jgi:predicted MPP superfamily phosphohydrolase
MSELLLDEEPDDILKEGWLHKAMLLMSVPDGWPGWALFLLIPVWMGLVGGVWWLALANGVVALATTAVLTLCLVGDVFMLHSLPRRGLSFGPWKSQFVVLALPRLTAALLLAGVGWLAGAWWGFALFVTVQVGASGAALWGFVIEPFRVGLSELTIVTDRLPQGATPIRFLHISDLHIERLTKRETAVLHLAQQAKPDFIVITGDYVNLSYNTDPVTHRQVRQLLQKLDAPHGVYATLGSITVDLREEVVPIFDGLPISLMRHAWQRVKLGAGREVVLLGMDCTHHLPTDRARLANLYAQAPNSVPQILLYHSPELMPEAAEHGLDLYLCGHTHGGQVRLPFVGPLLTSSQLGRRYVMGHYQEGRTHLYVSRGLGLEGLSAPRVRFLAPPEMVLVTLKCGNGGM